MKTAFITTLFTASALHAYAFSPASLSTRKTTHAPSTTACNVLLSEEETEAMMQSSLDCAEGECSIDDVSDLIVDLKAQHKEMTARMEDIMNMVGHLQTMNKADQRKKDSVSQYVKDLLRVFDTSKGGNAGGFSGDIGEGTTDAYKALDPKPWKP